MATATLLVIPVFNPFYRGYLWRAGLILGITAVGLALFFTPGFQERFFYSGSGTLSDVAEGNFNEGGRFVAWPLIWKEAWQNPVLGAGIGSVPRFVPTVWPRMTHEGGKRGHH